ncbi:MAG TPA: MBL fold metallo-hydrolase [Thermoanaerobaculia bacterium]|nr:MBL fold metallo-hydrolase [Thermoanaerobaculia bacterium]
MQRLTFLGASGTVTGSRYLLETDRSTILVDCGLFQGGRELRAKNWEPFPADPKSIRGVLLTHAHIDHTGYLPRLVREGYTGPVYCSAPTQALLKYLLPDAGRLQEEEAGYANRKGFSRHKPAEPLFTEEDANRALSLLVPVPFDQPSNVLTGIQFSFHRVGHILGAGFIRVQAGAASVLFSGDVGRRDVPILKDPEPILAASTVLLESTYGDRRHGSEPPIDALERVVGETIARRGMLLVPAFAVGRTQEILYYLRQLQREKKIPDDLPIWVDSPMAVSAVEIYRDFHSEHDIETTELEDENASPFDGRHVRLMRTIDESKSLNRAKGPGVIISASGMLNGGRIMHHLRVRLPDPATTLLFVGYQADETLGRMIENGATVARIHGESVPVRARIEEIPALSAHADQQELLDWFSKIPESPKRTYLVHGEDPARAALAERIRSELKFEVVLPRQNQAEELP